MSCLNIINSNITGKKICLYGLSGDPPTGEGGHRSIVEYLSKSRNNTTNINTNRNANTINGNKQVPTFDYIFVLPTYKYAIAEKSDQEKSYKFRLKLVKANFEGINDTKVKVLELEKEVLLDKIKKSKEYQNLINKPNNNKLLENPNFKKISTGSIDIIRYLKKNLDGAELYWCSGSDSVNDCLDGYWGHNFEILCSLSGWVVINRKIKIRKQFLQNTLKLLNRNLKNQVNQSYNTINARYKKHELTETQTKDMIMKKLRKYPNLKGDNFYFVSNPKFKDISSTKLRELLEVFLKNKNEYLNGNKIKNNKKREELIKQILEMMDEKVLDELIKNQNAVTRYSPIK
jgi:hypothetical protein